MTNNLSNTSRLVIARAPLCLLKIPGDHSVARISQSEQLLTGVRTRIWLRQIIVVATDDILTASMRVDHFDVQLIKHHDKPSFSGLREQNKCTHMFLPKAAI